MILICYYIQSCHQLTIYLKCKIEAEPLLFFLQISGNYINVNSIKYQIFDIINCHKSMQWTPDNICVQLATSVAKFL